MEQYQSTFVPADPGRTQLLAAAKAMVLGGNKEFSIAELCQEAGIERGVFHDQFAGKMALMAALMREYPLAAVAPLPAPTDAPRPAAVLPPEAISAFSISKAGVIATEPSVTAPDEWFDRRLRVFERALTSLEAKADTTAREQARVIADLQQRLKDATSSRPVPQLVVTDTLPLPEAMPEMAVLESLDPPVQDVAQVATQAEIPLLDDVSLAELPAAEQPHAAEPAVQAVPEEIKSEPVAEVAAGQPLPVTRLIPELSILRLPKLAGAGTHVRMMAIAATLLVGTFISVGFLMGRHVLDANAQERAPDGVAHRQAAQTVLHKTMALADAGDPRAQARLALAYLRGQGSAADANAALLWCVSAARSGNPVAEYLLGVLYQQGDHVAADPAQAAAWFSRAAEKGNLKAMHNLAIAYAQGLGTPKDEAKAAEWFNRAAERGYVDSAFDLAVLYERGEGVPQDLKQALKWYGIAAFAGDQPSKERVDFLRSQMKAADIKLATNAAMAFAPLPAVQEANSL
ncbi:MAG TPA: hypothetical protein VNX61_16545 [Rhizomicrobium sp.]|nr:hypothetical protein [Rhizomicrobium sp.]